MVDPIILADDINRALEDGWLQIIPRGGEGLSVQLFRGSLWIVLYRELLLPISDELVMTINSLPIIGEVEGLLEAINTFCEFIAINIICPQVALQPGKYTDPLWFAVDGLNDTVAPQRVLLVVLHLVTRCHQRQVVSELTELRRVQLQVHVGDLLEDHGGEQHEIIRFLEVTHITQIFVRPLQQEYWLLDVPLIYIYNMYYIHIFTA